MKRVFLMNLLKLSALMLISLNCLASYPTVPGLFKNNSNIENTRPYSNLVFDLKVFSEQNLSPEQQFTVEVLLKNSEEEKKGRVTFYDSDDKERRTPLGVIQLDPENPSILFGLLFHHIYNNENLVIKGLNSNNGSSISVQEELVDQKVLGFINKYIEEKEKEENTEEVEEIAEVEDAEEIDENEIQNLDEALLRPFYSKQEEISLNLEKDGRDYFWKFFVGDIEVQFSKDSLQLSKISYQKNIESLGQSVPVSIKHKNYQKINGRFFIPKQTFIKINKTTLVLSSLSYRVSNNGFKKPKQNLSSIDNDQLLKNILFISE